MTGERMKVAMAVHHFPPRYNGGAEWRAYRTASALQERGHRVEVTAVERIDAPAENDLTYRAENFQGVDVRRLSFDLEAAPDLFRWRYDNPWIGEYFERYFEETRPDVFHLIGGYLLTASALETARRMGIPTVVTLTDFWFLCARLSMQRSNGEISTLPLDPVRCARCLGEESRRYRIPGRLFPELMNLYWRNRKDKVQQMQARMDCLLQTLNQVDTIISPSRFLREFHIEAGVDPSRILFSRQGRNLSANPKPKQPSKGVLRIGYSGQISEHKGVHVLVDAVHKLPGAPLQVKIYGDLEVFPDYTRKLKTKAAGDPRIEFMGPYRRDELADVFAGLDVLVIPSMWRENSPNVILEAFGYQTPVIGTDFGGISELVDHGGSGLLFERGSAESLAMQIGKLLDESGLLERLQVGVPPVRSVSEEIDELEAIYRRVQSHANQTI